MARTLQKKKILKKAKVKTKTDKNKSSAPLKNHGVVLLYSTWPTQNQARRAARILLEKKLIACANIFPQIHSLFIWKGRTTQSSEVVMLIKTHKNCWEEAWKKTLELHPYDTPGLVKWPLEFVSGDYAHWVAISTKGWGLKNTSWNKRTKRTVNPTNTRKRLKV